MNAPSAIQAALLWDLPKLSRDTTHGTSAFVNVLELRGIRRTQGGSSLKAEPPLATAARGILAELEGDTEVASAIYHTLAANRSRWTSLLGEFLLCWSSTAGNETRYADLAKRLKRVEDPLLRSRLLWKLVTWAVDRGYRGLLEDLALQLIEATPRGSRLYDVGSTELLNLGFGHLLPRDPIPTSQLSKEEEVSLIDYPWIVWPALESARTSIADGFLARARHRRTATIHIGPPRSNRIFALHLQAEWAGALWLLRPLRQQLASQVIGSETSQDGQIGYACAMWIAGGGSDTRSVLDFAEPHFAPDTADYVVGQVAKAYRPPFFGDRQLSETLLGLWDEVSVELAEQLLAAVQVDAGDHPNENLGRRAFLSLGIRAPQQWAARYSSLPAHTKSAVAQDVAWLDVSLLPDAMVEELTRDDGVVKLIDEAPDAAKVAAIAIATRADVALAKSLVPRLPPTGIARVAAVSPDLVGEELARTAVQKVHDLLSRQLQDARHGRYNLGPEDIYGDYASLLVQLPAVNSEGLELIQDLALTPGMPLEMRSGALQIATQLAAHNKLSTALAERLIGTPEEGPSLWNVASPDMIHAQKLLLRVSAEKKITPDIEAELFVASRHSDPQVRNIPLLAIHNLGSVGGSSLVDAVLFGALYDDDRSVARNALALLSEINIEYVPSRPLVHERLRELYASGTREIRLAVVYAAKHALGHDDGGGDLIRDAANDRSWVIRRAVDVQA
jgi:hypothetical protein